MSSLLDKCKDGMDKALIAFERDIASVRSGRATPSLLDTVRVDVYGSLMPLSSLATINVADVKTLTVLIWDANNVQSVDSAIRGSDLGLNPRVEGNKLFISLPDLTEERRKEFIKMVKKKSEDMKVRIRNIRRDINEEYKKLEKDGDLSEDQLKSELDGVQKLTDSYIEKIEEMLKKKEKELLMV